jgi:hypothetical protein
MEVVAFVPTSCLLLLDLLLRSTCQHAFPQPRRAPSELSFYFRPRRSPSDTSVDDDVRLHHRWR